MEAVPTSEAHRLTDLGETAKAPGRQHQVGVLSLSLYIYISYIIRCTLLFTFLNWKKRNK